MKNKFILIFTLICFYTRISGQVNIALRLGGGGTYVKAKSVNTYNYSNLLFQYSGTIGIGINISEKNRLRGELQYTRKGYRFKIHNFLDQDKTSASFAIHYVVFTPLYSHRFQLKEKKRRKQKNFWDVLIGPYMGYRTKAHWKWADQIDTSKNNEIHNWDIGITTGLEYNRVLKNNHLISFDIRYSQGITNIYNHSFFQGYLRNVELGITYHWKRKQKKVKRRSKRG